MSDTFDFFSDSPFDSFGEGEADSTPAMENEYKLDGGVSLAVVDSDQAVCDYLSQLFGGNIDSAFSLSAIENQLGGESKVIILGPSCGTDSELAIVNRWSQTLPNIATVLVTAELSTKLLQKALRAGVRDVLGAPVDEGVLTETVHRLAQSLPSAGDLVSNPVIDDELPLEEMEGGVGKVISIFSTKGGSGKSVVATNLGIALARRSHAPVVLIDGHLQFGDAAVMMKMQQPKHTIVDALSHAEDLDAEMVRQFMSVHEPSGLLILSAPQEPMFADDSTGEKFAKVVEAAKKFAGHVLVDLPAFLNDLVFKVLQESDDVVLVTGLDIPNIKNVKIAMSTLAMLEIENSQIHLLLNRANSKVKLEVSEVERALGVTAAAYIPSDVVVPISVNRGSPVVLSAPKSGVARAFEELSLRFLDQRAGDAVVSVPTSGRRKFFG